ncbi:MAG: hypothetical protein AAFY60_18175 [Myxococcota bacterium]
MNRILAVFLVFLVPSLCGAAGRANKNRASAKATANASKKPPRVLVLSGESLPDGDDDQWHQGPAEPIEQMIRNGGGQVVELQGVAGPFTPDTLLDQPGLTRWAKKARAQVVFVVTMKVTFVRGESKVTARGSGDVLALDVKSGERLARMRVQTSMSSETEARAKELLYARWVRSFEPTVKSKIIEAWSERAEEGAVFRLTLEGGNAKQRARFVGALKRVPKVEKVRELARLDTRSSLSVHYRGSAEGLVRAVFQHVARRRPFKGLSRVGAQTQPIALELP